MKARTFARLGTALAGAAVSALAFAGTAQAASGTIMVPVDFIPALSDTRATGHYEVQGTGLHIWTESNTSTDKVAEYVDTSTPLAGIGEPSAELHDQLGDHPARLPARRGLRRQRQRRRHPGRRAHGLRQRLVGQQRLRAVRQGRCPLTHRRLRHRTNHGTLDQWRTAFPGAVVKAFGFSLGSGVLGDGMINSIVFNGTTYTFAVPVVLTSKDQCKNNGWKTSTSPVFKNQGDCISSFASAK